MTMKNGKRKYIVTNDEALRMVAEWRNTNCPARRQVLGGEVVSSLGFIIHTRLKPYRGAPYYDDLLQEGRIGIMRAMQDFDPERGKNFFKFAIWHVQTRIRRTLMKELRSQSVPDQDQPFLACIDTEEEFEQIEGRRVLMRALDFLSDKDRKVIIMRFGLDGTPPRTCQQIGQELGLSRQRVQQIENKALRCLETDADMRQFFCEA